MKHLPLILCLLAFGGIVANLAYQLDSQSRMGVPQPEYVASDLEAGGNKVGAEFTSGTWHDPNGVVMTGSENTLSTFPAGVSTSFVSTSSVEIFKGASHDKLQ